MIHAAEHAEGDTDGNKEYEDDYEPEEGRRPGGGSNLNGLDLARREVAAGFRAGELDVFEFGKGLQVGAVRLLLAPGVVFLVVEVGAEVFSFVGGVEC